MKRSFNEDRTSPSSSTMRRFAAFITGSHVSGKIRRVRGNFHVLQPVWPLLFGSSNILAAAAWYAIGG
jgi:hypothetical protein